MENIYIPGYGTFALNFNAKDHIYDYQGEPWEYDHEEFLRECVEESKVKFTPEMNTFYGKTHSEESRIKMSTKAKMVSNTDLGKKQRSENGKKAKGKKWWNNGTSHKRSEKCPGREWVAGRINFIGKPHTQESKEKMSRIKKEYWKQKKGV